MATESRTRDGSPQALGGPAIRLRPPGWTVVLAVMLAGCAAVPAARGPAQSAASEGDLAAAEDAARTAANALFSRLNGELMAALQTGGPIAAIDVCKVRAPMIAAEIEADTGVDIERTSLKVRNPRNAPSEWERQTLQAFEARHAAGEAWPGMEARRVVGGTLHWMRPIPMGGMCVSCHGAGEVAPETAAAIAAAYPRDVARGFSVGQLRGGFSARVPLGGAAKARD